MPSFRFPFIWNSISLISLDHNRPLSIQRLYMAYAHPVQRRVVVPGQAPLIVVDPRTLVFSPAPPPPPVGYLPGAIPAIAGPAFPGVVVAPVALRLNPASLLRIDEQRTHELIQVIFFLLFFLDFFLCSFNRLCYCSLWWARAWCLRRRRIWRGEMRWSNWNRSDCANFMSFYVLFWLNCAHSNSEMVWFRFENESTLIERGRNMLCRVERSKPFDDWLGCGRNAELK